MMSCSEDVLLQTRTPPFISMLILSVFQMWSGCLGPCFVCAGEQGVVPKGKAKQLPSEVVGGGGMFPLQAQVFSAAQCGHPVQERPALLVRGFCALCRFWAVVPSAPVASLVGVF